MPIIHTADLDSHFFPGLEEVADELSTLQGTCNPKHLASVMMSESGVRADAWNDNPKALPPEKRFNASGLIQFMPKTLLNLGWSQGHAAFRNLTATQQLPYVRRYFSPYRGLLTSIGAIYTATFLPALLEHAQDPDYVLCAKNGPLGWAYGPNAVFDENRDYTITVRELEQAVVRNCTGKRWMEIVSRLAGGVAEVQDLHDPGLDLGSIVGLQRALATLGFDPGLPDGVAGPRTRAAVVQFQREHGLVPDGIYGRVTRSFLEAMIR